MSTQHYEWEGEESEEEEELRDPKGVLRCLNQAFTLFEGENTVGRGKDNDIIVDDPSVSERHALITVMPDGKSALIKDNESTNKTKYQHSNGDSWEIIKSKQPAILKNGANLRFGAVEASLGLGEDAVVAVAPTQNCERLPAADEETDDEGLEGGEKKDGVQQGGREEEEGDIEDMPTQAVDEHVNDGHLINTAEGGKGEPAIEGGGSGHFEKEAPTEALKGDDDDDGGVDDDETASHVSEDLFGESEAVEGGEAEDGEEDEKETVQQVEREEATVRVSMATSDTTAVDVGDEDTETEGEEDEEDEAGKGDTGVQEGQQAVNVALEVEQPAGAGETLVEETVMETGPTEDQEVDETKAPEAAVAAEVAAAEAEEEMADARGGEKHEEAGGVIAEEVEDQAGDRVDMMGEGETALECTMPTQAPPKEQEPEITFKTAEQQQEKVEEEAEPVEEAATLSAKASEGNEQVVEGAATSEGPEEGQAAGVSEAEVDAPSTLPQGGPPADVEEEAPKVARQKARRRGAAPTRTHETQEGVSMERAKASSEHSAEEEENLGAAKELAVVDRNVPSEAEPEGPARAKAGRKRGALAVKKEAVPAVSEENDTAVKQGTGKGRRGHAAAAPHVKAEPVKEADDKRGRGKMRGAAAEAEEEEEEVIEVEVKPVVDQPTKKRPGGARAQRQVVKEEKEKKAASADDEGKQEEAAAASSAQRRGGRHEGAGGGGKSDVHSKVRAKRGAETTAADVEEVEPQMDEPPPKSTAPPSKRAKKGAAGGGHKQANKEEPASKEADEDGASQATKGGSASCRGGRHKKEDEVKPSARSTGKRGKKVVQEQEEVKEEEVMEVDPPTTAASEASEVTRGRKRPGIVVKEEKAAEGKKRGRRSSSQAEESLPAVKSESMSAGEESQSRSMHLREKTATRRTKVAFSCVKLETHDKKSLQKLACDLVEDVREADVLIGTATSDGLKFKRTPKILTAIARGIPVVDRSWLEESAKGGTLLSCDERIVSDAEAEKKWGFTLIGTINKARARPMLSGWAVAVVSKRLGDGMPSADELQFMVEAAGGKWLGAKPKVADVRNIEESLLVISEDASLRDNKLGPLARGLAEAKDSHVYALESILSGILHQSLAMDQNILWRCEQVGSKASGGGGGKGGATGTATRASKRSK